MSIDKNEIKVNMKEEPVRKVEPIPKSLTIWSVSIILFILIVAVVGVILIPSPDASGGSFLVFLFRNMNILH